MRVLIIHNHYQDAGGEDDVFEQEYSLLAGVTETRALRYFNRKGLKGLIQFALYPWNLFAVRRAAKVVKRFRPNIVHIHNLHYAVGPLLIRMLHKRGIPTVMTLHNYRLLCPTATLFHAGNLFMNSTEGGFPWRAILKGVYGNSAFKTFWLAATYTLHRRLGTWKMVDRYLVLTQFARDLFIRHLPNIPAGKFVVKPNFLPDPISPAETATDKQRQEHFLFVGRLSEEKGVHVLLEAFQGNDARLRIAGTGPLNERVLKAAQTNANIEYLGVLDRQRVIAEMRHCTALIFPSVWFEGMPMTLIQAFATATPVIASRLGAMETMIDPDKNGMFFEAGNSEDLRRAVSHWIDMPPNIKQQTGNNARAMYETHYTPVANKRLLLDEYRTLIDSSNSQQIPNQLIHKSKQ